MNENSLAIKKIEDWVEFLSNNQKLFSEEFLPEGVWEIGNVWFGPAGMQVNFKLKDGSRCQKTLSIDEWFFFVRNVKEQDISGSKPA